MSLLIQNMFDKEIDRDIQGVIIVGQDEDKNVKQELEEYVVTSELEKHVDTFFESYKDGVMSTTDGIGIWISGFFGSGKSHFLKILSYLLENKIVDGKKAIEYFNGKGLGNFTLGNMKYAGDLTTDVILFNIDSKSDSDGKMNKGAIVNVFNKVFNEMQGFCASTPWIADLERNMLDDGVYESFKTAFEELSGTTWEDGRENFFYEEDSIIKALVKCTKMSQEAARNWYNKCEEDYSLSIEKFAKRVNKYIESKGKNHQVVFLVDEIGQYIGADVGLMLNLQTVVEDIGTHCKGRCWVVATSQEGLDEFTKVNRDNFSKIQGRFKTRLSLSSANVDEVIKKRILKKKEAVISHLKLVYDQKESIIKNLLTFTTEAEMKIYKNSDDFAEVYPFIPYQFNLLQATFNGVREHGASGKSLSKGERSLLGAFQQVAVDHMYKETGVLIPFSAFYSTIQTFLDSSIRSVILHAEQNDKLDTFDVEVLKLLFLIKYVKEIPANLENLATLMVTHIDQDKVDLKQKIQVSLNKLVGQVLIQQNGEEYIFLTNDEQDINKDIDKMDVDMAEVIQKIGDIIFDDIYSEKKFKYSREYHFAFNQLTDDRPKGSQTNEIGIRIITPNYDLVGGASDSELRLQSSRENNMIVNISKDGGYIDEVQQALKISTYLKVRGSSRGTNTIEIIKTKKSVEKEERLKRAKILIEQALRSGDIYVNGNLLPIKEKAPVDRLNEGLKALIDSKYNKISYIKSFSESAKDLYTLMDTTTNQMSLEGHDPNKLALDELDTHIAMAMSRNLPVTVKSVLTKYTNAPYGWKDTDIQALIIRLFKNQEIRAIVSNDYIAPNDREIVTYVTKRDYLERTLLKKREKVSQKYITAVKDLTKDLFGFSSLPSDEDGMMTQFKLHCTNELEQIKDTLRIYTVSKPYPGKKILQSGKQLFEQVLTVKDTNAFFKTVYDLENDFLDYADAIDQIKAFFYKKANGRIDMTEQGEQVVLFDKTLDKLNNFEDNTGYIIDSAVKDIIDNMRTILRMEKPYSRIQELPLLVDAYDTKILELLEKESEPVNELLERCKGEVIETAAEYALEETFTPEIYETFKELLLKLESANSFVIITSISNLAEKAKVSWIQKLLSEHQRLNQPKAPTSSPTPIDTTLPPSTGGAGYVAETPTIKITTKTLSMRELVKGQKTIKNEDDIEVVLEVLRKKLKDQLETNTIINLV